MSIQHVSHKLFQAIVEYIKYFHVHNFFWITICPNHSSPENFSNTSLKTFGNSFDRYIVEIERGREESSVYKVRVYVSRRR